jgi:hypothetical protein
VTRAGRGRGGYNSHSRRAGTGTGKALFRIIMVASVFNCLGVIGFSDAEGVDSSLVFHCLGEATQGSTGVGEEPPPHIQRRNG